MLRAATAGRPGSQHVYACALRSRCAWVAVAVTRPAVARGWMTTAASPQPTPPPPPTPTSETTWQMMRRMLSAGRAARAEKAAAAAGGGGEGKASEGKLNSVSLARLLKFVKPEVVPLSVSVGTLGITTGVSLLFPYAIGEILDSTLATSSGLTPATISLGLLGLFAVQSVLIVVRSALLTISGERMAAAIRRDLFASILSQEVAWYDKHRTGDVINRLSSDTVIIQKALTNNIANGLRSSAMVVGGTGMLFYLSPSLAMLSLALIPPVAVAGMYYGRYLQGQQKAVQEALGKTTEMAEELVSAVRTVRQFAREGVDAARFSAAVMGAYEQAKRIGVVAAYFDGAVHMAANLSLIAVLWYGGHLVATGAMTPGSLTSFLMYSLYTGFNISSISSVYTELKRAAGAAMRIVEITDRQPAMPLSGDGEAYWAATSVAASPTAAGAAAGVAAHAPSLPSVLEAGPSESSLWLKRLPSPLPDAALAAVRPRPHAAPLHTGTMTGAITFQDVTFAYPARHDVPIMTGLSLAIPAGKTVAVVGTSGSGKSTLAALLTRLYDVDGGAVQVDGIDVKAWDPSTLRRQIGVVAQEPTLFATTIAENIRYGARAATDDEVVAAARLAHVDNVIRAFPDGYNTLVGERGVQLSGGQKQRVAIARALIKSPKVLLMDEATSALDAESESAIMAALEEVRRGRTVITIAHRLSTMKHADLVAVLGQGRVVEYGPFDELYNRPTSLFRQLIAKQTGGYLPPTSVEGGVA